MAEIGKSADASFDVQPAFLLFSCPVQTIVIGHRNPDMDSVCSALAYARLKQALGWKDVVAARAGNLNERIQFVLDKFGVEPPVFLSDVTPQVRDVMTRGVVSAARGSIRRAGVAFHRGTPGAGVARRGRGRALPGFAERDHAAWSNFSRRSPAAWTRRASCAPACARHRPDVRGRHRRRRARPDTAKCRITC